MTEYLLKVDGLADGSTFSLPVWLMSYDTEYIANAEPTSIFTSEGAIIYGSFGGKVILTTNRVKALRFPDKATAMVAWSQQSLRIRLRPDGRPNRPLTAFTVEVEPV
jgi:hypothetical protein